MRTIENILYHELIGLKIKLCECSQSSIINLSGQIIFETKNMLIIRTLNDIKKIPKKINPPLFFWWVCRGPPLRRGWFDGWSEMHQSLFGLAPPPSLASACSS